MLESEVMLALSRSLLVNNDLLVKKLKTLSPPIVRAPLELKFMPVTMAQKPIKMPKQEELLTSKKEFDCREKVNPWSCEQCGFSSPILLSFIRHQKEGCGNKMDNPNFILDAYKCRNCEFVSCSCIMARRHETRCCMVATAKSASSTSLWICSHCETSISYRSPKFGTSTFECGDQRCYTSTRIEELKEHAIFVHLPDECIKFLFASDGVKSKSTEPFSCEHPRQEFGHEVELNKHINQLTPLKEVQVFASDQRKPKYERRLPMDRLIKRTKTQDPVVDSQRLKFHKRSYKSDCGIKSQHRLGLRNVKNKRKRSPVVDTLWFECQSCPYETKSKSHLRRHKLSKHTPDENIKWCVCKKCEYKSKRRDTLNAHIIRKHGEKRISMV